MEIKRLNPNQGVKIYAKLEGFNPTGSVKDRIGVSMIEAAGKDGRLTKDTLLVGPTGGNTGIIQTVQYRKTGILLNITQHASAVDASGKARSAAHTQTEAELLGADA